MIEGTFGSSFFWLRPGSVVSVSSAQCTMAPKAKAGAMKAAAMKGAAALSKSGIVNAMIEGTEIKRSVCKQTLDNLAAVATKEVKGIGKFTIPGLCMLKPKNKPATKAGKREVFGKVVMVKAKPASKVVKAYCVAALKKSIQAATWHRCSSGHSTRWLLDSAWQL